MKILREKIFAAVAVFIIFSFLIYLPFAYFSGKKSSAADLGNNRLYSDFTGESFCKFKTKINHIEVDLQNMILNRFPFYDSIVGGINSAEHFSDKIICKNKYGYVPVLYSNGVFYYDNIHKKRYYRLLDYNENAIKDSIKYASAYYNRYFEAAHKANPDISMSIFAVPMTWDPKANSSEFFYPYDEFALYKLFSKNLSENIKSDILNVNSSKDFEKYFFKTDHHWNIHGAYAGYLEAGKLMGIDEPARNIEIRTLEKVKFRGSISRTLLSESYFDIFEIPEADLPYHIIKVNGSPAPINFSMKNEYLRGKFPNSTYENHYGNFYHPDVGLIEYDFQSPHKGNLLLIGDSLSNCIEDLLASHYNKTFIIDQRLYESQDTNWMSSFVSNNHITDILIMSSTNGIYNHYPDKIGLEVKNK